MYRSFIKSNVEGGTLQRLISALKNNEKEFAESMKKDYNLQPGQIMQFKTELGILEKKDARIGKKYNSDFQS